MREEKNEGKEVFLIEKWEGEGIGREKKKKKGQSQGVRGKSG